MFSPSTPYGKLILQLRLADEDFDKTTELRVLHCLLSRHSDRLTLKERDIHLNSFCSAYGWLDLPSEHGQTFLKYSKEYLLRLDDPTCFICRSGENLNDIASPIRLNRIITYERLHSAQPQGGLGQIDWSTWNCTCANILIEASNFFDKIPWEPEGDQTAVWVRVLGHRAIANATWHHPFGDPPAAWRDISEMKRLLREGYGRGAEMWTADVIAVVSTHIRFSDDTDFALSGPEAIEDFKMNSRVETIARQIVQENGFSVAFQSRFTVEQNVESLNIEFLSQVLDSKFLLLGDLSKSLPVVCALRALVDAMVHLALTFEERRVISSLGPGFARNELLRYSDSLKSPLLLSDKLQSLDPEAVVREDGIFFHDIFLPSSLCSLLSEVEGFIVVFHLILNCQLCSDCVVRWVIRDGEIIRCDRRLPRNRNLASLCHYFVQIAGEGISRKRLRRSAPEQFAVCRELFQLLLGGLEDLISQTDAITFIPDRDLFRVPFCCLLDPSDGKFLIEKCSISISSSVRLIGCNARQKEASVLAEPRNPFALVCGLPKSDIFFRGEMNAVVKAFSQHFGETGGDCVVLVGKAFVPIELRRIICGTESRPSLIHVVSHGLSTDEENRYDDALAQFHLTGRLKCASRRVLRASEFATDFDLHGTDLVFLNCCCLADGQQREVGILGFNRACFQAGCPSVVSALWPVYSDLSHDLACEFYSRLFAGYDKVQAFRLAVLKNLGKDRVPVMWGAFQLYGNRF